MSLLDLSKVVPALVVGTIVMALFMLHTDEDFIIPAWLCVSGAVWWLSLSGRRE